MPTKLKCCKPKTFRFILKIIPQIKIMLITFYELNGILMNADCVFQISVCVKKPLIMRRRLIPSVVLWSTWHQRL